MNIAESTPSRTKVVQGIPYEMPQPFTADDFTSLSNKGIDLTGFARQANQVLAENVGNILAARIKGIKRRNEDLAAAQAAGNRTDEQPEAFPEQSDVDEIFASYDFTGARVSSGESAAVTDVERAFTNLMKKLMRGILKKHGLRNMKAPVTVAKNAAKKAPNQIDQETFMVLVEAAVNGEGPWSENPELVQARASLMEQAEAQVAATSMASSSLENALRL